jgi:hypothetical protein
MKLPFRVGGKVTNATLTVLVLENVNMNIIIVLCIMLAGLLGAWYHWIEVKKREDVGSFIDYFFRNNTDGSKATVVAFVAAMESLYIAGAFKGIDLTAVIASFQSGEFNPTLMLALSIAFGAGYACDSKLNSGSLPSESPVPASPTIDTSKSAETTGAKA